MEVTKTSIEGLLIFEPKVFSDPRGYFFESYNQKTFCEAVGRNIEFVQDNESKSEKNVLRGMHFQKPPFAQGKLVRVSQGAVLDVAIDLRLNSPTYGKHEKVVLTEDNKLQFWIPEGFAHGFLTLEENTVFNYKCTNFYSKMSEVSLSWDDPTFDIDWGIKNPLLSEKDLNCEIFSKFASPF